MFRSVELMMGRERGSDAVWRSYHLGQCYLSTEAVPDFLFFEAAGSIGIERKC